MCYTPCITDTRPSCLKQEPIPWGLIFDKQPNTDPKIRPCYADGKGPGYQKICLINTEESKKLLPEWDTDKENAARALLLPYIDKPRLPSSYIPNGYIFGLVFLFLVGTMVIFLPFVLCTICSMVTTISMIPYLLSKQNHIKDQIQNPV